MANKKENSKVIDALGFIQQKNVATNIFSNYYSNDVNSNYFYDNICFSDLLKLTIKKFFEKLGISTRNKKETNFSLEISKVINTIKAKKKIIVFAPFYNGKKDGYLKRIEYIDSTLLKDYVKIYVNCTGEAKLSFNVTKYDDKHTYITFNSFDDAQLNAIVSLINAIKLTYTHSINMFMLDDVNYKLLKIFDNKKLYNIIDIHGAVPEEIQGNYDDDRYIMASYVENYIFTRCSLAIYVTEAMKKYYVKKYNLKNTMLVPVDNTDSLGSIEIIKEKKFHKKPTIIYAGGLQKWQNIDLMNEIITKTVDRYNYEIYVSDVEEYCKKLDKSVLDKIIVDHLTQEELIQRYKNADFGFVLRDKNAVNEVAFPTKLVEYIKYGIVPIYKSENVGDFPKYMHINYEDILNCKYDIDIKKVTEYNFTKYISKLKKTINMQPKFL